MQKILSIFMLAMACASITYAQTEKGTKNLGLNLGYHSSNQKTSVTDFNTNVNYPLKTTGNTYIIGPSFSYFIANKVEIGVSAAYGYHRTKIDYITNSQTVNGQYTDYGMKQRDFGGTLFLRRHIMFTDQFGLRTGPYFSYTYSELKSDADYKSVTKSYIGGIDLGIEYFPIKKIGIAANLADLSYNHSNQNVSNSSELKSNSFGFNLTNSLNLSIVWVFGN